MNTNQRLVVRLPLESLWDEHSKLEAFQQRELTSDNIKALLRLKAIRFVVADCGLPLLWIEKTDCYEFWKSEVQCHLWEEAKPYLDDYPNGYFYFAFEWKVADAELVIVLEKHH